MKIGFRFINGLVFGISHHTYMSVQAADESLEEAVKNAETFPVVVVHLGPIQLVITW